jgi:hypothetical protein
MFFPDSRRQVSIFRWRKYDSALSHIVVMQHVTKERLAGFLQDMKAAAQG